MKTEDLTRFFFELGQLRRIRHEGWRLVGVEHPETVASHSLRAAQIGYFIAVEEGYEKPEDICAMLVFHDIGEARVGDMHKVAARYGSVDEEQAIREQVAPFGNTGEAIIKMFLEFENRSTQAGIIAKDADELEQALTAREFVVQGHAGAERWIVNVRKTLRTQTALDLLDTLRTSDPYDWWHDIQKLQQPVRD